MLYLLEGGSEVKDGPKLDPHGIARFFVFIILGAVVLLVLPVGLRAIVGLLQMFEKPPDLPDGLGSEQVRLVVWALVVALVVAAAIRLIRRI